MSSPIKILQSETVKIELPEGVVEVREMDWMSTLAFIEKLSATAGQVLKVDDGKTRVDLSDLVKLFAGSRELVAELVTKSTGKDTDWLGKQSPRAVLALLDAAIEINLSDELKKLGKSVGLRVVEGLGVANRTPNAQTSPT